MKFHLNDCSRGADFVRCYGELLEE